jgi:hypothetical protein
VAECAARESGDDMSFEEDWHITDQHGILMIVGCFIFTDVPSCLLTGAKVTAITAADQAS